MLRVESLPAIQGSLSAPGAVSPVFSDFPFQKASLSTHPADHQREDQSRQWQGRGPLPLLTRMTGVRGDEAHASLTARAYGFFISNDKESINRDLTRRDFVRRAAEGGTRGLMPGVWNRGGSCGYHVPAQ